ncbi:pupal cuticle protein C1B-like [Wyeomyia smithii]|uniref:pupal cuticle protein C1B-like n=1 Tax=Wyeomyia smithii TaxID=174621 RepID=UPI002467CEDB|nr:pupal cuticle protein C1B-like [Wyeomyia smithii]
MFAKLIILAIAIAAVAARPGYSAVTSYSSPVFSAVAPTVVATRAVPYAAPYSYSGVVPTAYSAPVASYSYGAPVASYAAGAPVVYSAGGPVGYSSFGVSPYTYY